MDSSTERGVERLMRAAEPYMPFIVALGQARKAMLEATEHMMRNRRYAAIATLSRAMDEIDKLGSEDDEYPEVDDYGRRFRWTTNYSTMKHEREYAPQEGEEE